MSTDARADNRFAQKQLYSTSFQSHTLYASVPFIIPQRVQSLLQYYRGPPIGVTSCQPVPRSALDTT